MSPQVANQLHSAPKVQNSQSLFPGNRMGNMKSPCRSPIASLDLAPKPSSLKQPCELLSHISWGSGICELLLGASGSRSFLRSQSGCRLEAAVIRTLVWGRKTCFPDGSLPGLLAGQPMTPHVGLFVGLIECPPHMAPSFRQDKLLQRERQGGHDALLYNASETTRCYACHFQFVGREPLCPDLTQGK